MPRRVHWLLHPLLLLLLSCGGAACLGGALERGPAPAWIGGYLLGAGVLIGLARLIRAGFRFSFAALLAFQVLLLLGLGLYFHYHRGSHYPLWVCGAGYAGLALLFAAGWWLLPALLPGRSRPAGLFLAGAAGCLAVALVFPRLRPPLTVVRNPEFPTVAGLAPGSAEAQARQKAEARRHGLPVEIVNSVGMRFRFIPAGEFWQGSPGDELSRREDEIRHRETIRRPFYLGATEVTQAQWQAVTGENPSNFQGGNLPEGISDGGALPVEMVKWEDCRAFAARLCRREWVPDGTYRLPTEAEWEYACRAGTETALYSGAVTVVGTSEWYASGEWAPADPRLELIGWYAANAGSTRVVAGKAANAWGLHDMCGNVWEWGAEELETVAEMGDRGYHEAILGDQFQVQRLPLDGQHVLRGGCWGNDARYCRAANRSCEQETTATLAVGLRLVRETRPRPRGGDLPD